ncbi:Atu4866 domain-containing protein [Promicromonospora sp. NPDC090134]|uniref:Atu4866 domain-containing protein n=1 Tax=Promicromonospora sp. NPDC090134 TaxID=3364408 RepID=UPI0038229D6D
MTEQTDIEQTGRQFVLRGATVMRTPSTSARENLYVSDGVLVEPLTGEPAVVEATGTYAVPLTVDSAVAQRPVPQRHVHDLVPGNRATFALVRRPVGESQIRRMLVIDPADLAAVYVSGHLEARDGRPTRPAGADLSDPAVRETWVGTWVDPARGLEQHLMADGRYSETRNGRADAYTGRYWVRDGRITYLDDSGFWAFGELLDGTLHHAGFVMNRRCHGS